MKAAVEKWFSGRHGLDPAHLVFLEETYTFIPSRACADALPVFSGFAQACRNTTVRSTTMVAGLCMYGLVAPSVVDGPINHDAFQAYLDRVLPPGLTSGDMVLLDNLSSHGGPATHPRGRWSAIERLVYTVTSNERANIFTTAKNGLD